MDYYLGYFLSIIVAVISTIKNYFRSVIVVWKLPGPPAVPFFGNALKIKNSKELLEIGINGPKQYGQFFRVWAIIIPTVVIYHPRHLKVILSTNKNNEKNIYYKLLLNFLGRGLITNNGEKWKRNRKMIQPYFHINILEKYIEIFDECANRFVSKLQGEKTIKITSFVNEAVLDILHNGILGVPLDLDSPYRKGEVMAIDRIVKPWLMFNAIFRWTSSAREELKQKNSLESYTKQILLNRKKESKSTKACLMDMFMEMAENNPQFTDDDVINEVVTFMLAGQDSVGATTAFTIFYLAKYPEVQDKVFKEISTFEFKDRISMTELNEMKYLEQVLKETMRLVPAVPLMARVLTEDINLDDTLVPKGTNILVSPFMTHRLEDVYPDPLTFNPDRFEESKLEQMHPYQYLPFSLGPRNCIGNKFAIMELKTILYYFVKKYEVRQPPGKEEYNLAYRATLRATGGIWITLTPRQ